MPHIGAPELILILVVILIVFGVGKLPQVGGAVGKGLRAFRQGQRGEDDELEEEPQPKKAAPKRKVKRQLRNRGQHPLETMIQGRSCPPIPGR